MKIEELEKLKEELPHHDHIEQEIQQIDEQIKNIKEGNNNEHN